MLPTPAECRCAPVAVEENGFEILPTTEASVANKMVSPGGHLLRSARGG